MKAQSSPLFPLKEFGEQIALIDGDKKTSVSYADLALFQEELAIFPIQRNLVFLFSENHWPEVAAYIAFMNRGDVVCALDAHLETEIKKISIGQYEPDFIVTSQAGENYPGYEHSTLFQDKLIVWRKKKIDPCQMHPDLQLLLSTSGTTGSPKMIRLSRKNITSNARAIREYLHISSSERAMVSLPLHYSYGLSILHSHLLSGASLVLTQSSVIQSPFWDLMRQFACTSLAGVPYTYLLLDRIGFDPAEFPHLHTMTQAGGHLDKELVLKFFHAMKKKGGLFFVMYGQTEATARISYLPPRWLPQKAGSIGQAIPGGTLRISGGELIYEGSNVMMGYAEKLEDLAKGDELKGVLRTGDLGYCDEDNLFFVTGRSNRISKIFGYRISLDELEAFLRPCAQVAATTDDQQIYLYFELDDPDLFEHCIHQLSSRYHLHPSAFACRQITSFPRTAAGKIDYRKLQAGVL